MRANYELVRQKCDEQIRGGQIQLARAELRKLTHSKIPAPMVASFAELTRRTGLFHLGLKWLNSRVRADLSSALPVTAEEKLAYAALLIKVGCHSEAHELLKSLDGFRPEVHLYMAFIHIQEWDYREALPHLRRYIASRGLQPYQRMIGKMNLASAYVALDENAKGEELLSQIRSETAERGWKLFHKNALELSVQLASAQGQWQRTQSFLEQATPLLEPGAFTSLYLKKWEAVVALRRDGPKAETLKKISLVRSEAEALHDWSTIRECDFHLAHATHDRDLMLKLYFGTPYAGYRKRIERVTMDWLKIPTEFVVALDGSTVERALDLGQGHEVGGEASIEVGSAPHRILRVLATDLYRPRPLSCLFALTYPNDYFDPISSTKRALQQIHRLRGWLEENKIPIVIHYIRDGYILRSSKPYGLLVRKEEPAPPNRDDLWLQALKNAFPRGRFTSSGAARLLQISQRAAQTFLTQAEQQKRVSKFGRGRATTYYFKR